MNYKVESSGFSTIGVTTDSRAPRTERASAETARGAEPRPTAAAEPARELYAETRQTEPGTEPVNLDAVRQIRDLITEGRYPIDLGKIARKMLEMDLPPQGDGGRGA